jgi:hypothetical protein
MRILLTPVGLVASEDGRLRLLDRPPICHGYANGCVCVECVERAAGPVRAPSQPRQPWETAA